MAITKNYVAFRSAVWGGASGGVFIDVLGPSLQNAAFAWAFAPKPGAAPLFTLSNANAGVQGVSRTWQADMVNPLTGAVMGGTRIVPQIDEATLEGLTLYDGIRDLQLVHTLYVTPSGGSKFAFLEGVLTIKQGAPN